MKRLLFLITFSIFANSFSAYADGSSKAKLDSCISYYQDGDYQKAVDSIKAILPLISDRREEAEAYKYLGFSYVMLDLINKAKEFFRVALEKFPQMVIDTLEVPPNISIVFKQAKLEKQIEKGSGFDKSVENKVDKRVMWGRITTIAGALSAGAGGYLLYTGFQARDKYRSINTPYNGYQQDLDHYGDKMKNDMMLGGGAAGFAAINLGVGLYLLLKKSSAEPKKFGIMIDDRHASLSWNF